MAVTFHPRALRPAELPEPPAEDSAFYAILRDHPALAGLGLSVELANEPSARTAPWVRLAVVRHLEPSRPGESTPICSLDVFAEGLVAEDIARTIWGFWPFLKKLDIPDAFAYTSGAWVEVDPFRMAEPDEAEDAAPLVRYHLEVGLRLHPLPDRSTLDG